MYLSMCLNFCCINDHLNYYILTYWRCGFWFLSLKPSSIISLQRIQCREVVITLYFEIFSTAYAVCMVVCIDSWRHKSNDELIEVAFVRCATCRLSKICETEIVYFVYTIMFKKILIVQHTLYLKIIYTMKNNTIRKYIVL